MISLLLCLAGMSVLMPSCRDNDTGTGIVVEKTYDVADFDVLQVSTFMYVTLRHGDKAGVSIKADSAVMSMIDVSSRHGCLWLGVDDREGYAKLLNRYTRIDVEITYTSLKELMCTGAVKVTLADTLRCPELELSLRGASILTGAVEVENRLRLSVVGASSLQLSHLQAGLVDMEVRGASSLQLAYMQAERVEMEVTGASTVELGGRAHSAELAFMGSSVFKGETWKVDSLFISAIGASTATVYAVNALQADALGASTIRYVGMPDSLTESATGASRIQPL